MPIVVVWHAVICQLVLKFPRQGACSYTFKHFDYPRIAVLELFQHFLLCYLLSPLRMGPRLMILNERNQIQLFALRNGVACDIVRVSHEHFGITSVVADTIPSCVNWHDATVDVHLRVSWLYVLRVFLAEYSLPSDSFDTVSSKNYPPSVYSTTIHDSKTLSPAFTKTTSPSVKEIRTFSPTCTISTALLSNLTDSFGINPTITSSNAFLCAEVLVK